MPDGDNDTVKVIEVIGESSESWDDAAERAVADASETLDELSGVKLVEQSAKVENDEIAQYRATMHIAFPIER